MTTDTILTNDEIHDLGMSHDVNGPYSFARAIEQAVLQSEQVQAWRRDVTMLDWLISQQAQMQSMARPNGGNIMHRVAWPDDDEYAVSWHSCPRASISAAMERQTLSTE